MNAMISRITMMRFTIITGCFSVACFMILLLWANVGQWGRFSMTHFFRTILAKRLTS